MIHELYTDQRSRNGWSAEMNAWNMVKLVWLPAIFLLDSFAVSRLIFPFRLVLLRFMVCWLGCGDPRVFFLSVFLASSIPEYTSSRLEYCMTFVD